MNACMLTHPLIPLTKNGTSYSELGVSTSINLIKTMPQDMSTGQFNVDNGPSILSIPSDLSCCQIDKASYCRQTFSRIHIVGKKWCFVFPQANILLGSKMQLAMGFVRTIVEDGGAWVNIAVITPNSIKYRSETVNLVYITHHQCHKHQH